MWQIFVALRGSRLLRVKVAVKGLMALFVFQSVVVVECSVHVCSVTECSVDHSDIQGER